MSPKYHGMRHKAQKVNKILYLVLDKELTVRKDRYKLLYKEWCYYFRVYDNNGYIPTDKIRVIAIK